MSHSAENVVDAASQDVEDRQLLSLMKDIEDIVRKYNSTGIPKTPRKIRTNLKDRLILTWGTNAKIGANSTNWRIARARDLYLEVFDSSPHLFVAFISVVSPTTCSTPDFWKIVTKLLRSPILVQLQLNAETKDFFRSVAVDGAFTDNPGYIRFANAIFPEGLHGPN